jgi:hypothetical protein
MDAVEPMPIVPFAVDDVTLETVAAAVSYERERAAEAALSLVIASVNFAAATEIEPVPDCVLVVGVNTTEYTVDDVVVSVPMLPPETVMSPAVKLDEASESVNVMVSVWSDFSDPEPAREMVTVGAVVSTF